MSGDAVPQKPFSFGEAAMDGHLADEPHEKILALPENIKKRVKALRKLQLDSMNVEAEFYKRVHDLEVEFAEKFAPIHAQREQIVSGKREPSEEEASFPLFSQIMHEMIVSFGVKKTAIATPQSTLKDAKLANGDSKVDNAKSEAPPPYEEVVPDSEVSGVPDFWLTVLKNCAETVDMIQDHDEAILKHLTNVDCTMSKDPMKFRIEFQFSANEYFTNTTLTKEYNLSCEPEEKDPFSFDGPEVTSCIGCTIDWKQGKNVTVKLVKKKQKHREKQQTRFVTKQVKADSFFNFFEPPKPEDGQKIDEMDEEVQAVLEADFELGLLLRDRIIPRATLYYTGEADDNDYDDEDLDEDEEESEEDDEDH